MKSVSPVRTKSEAYSTDQGWSFASVTLVLCSSPSTERGHTWKVSGRSVLSQGHTKVGRRSCDGWSLIHRDEAVPRRQARRRLLESGRRGEAAGRGRVPDDR